MDCYDNFMNQCLPISNDEIFFSETLDTMFCLPFTYIDTLDKCISSILKMRR